MNDSEQPVWFPAMKYGWGWGFPVTWQGWLFLFVWVVALFGGVTLNQVRSFPGYVFPGFLVVMILILLAVCLTKGEKPAWRWGN